MKILADENFDRSIVEWLRAEGHDVLYAAEAMPAASDDELWSQASESGRFLLTYDRHFGEKAIFEPLDVPGALLVRFRYGTTLAQLRHFLAIWHDAREMLTGHLVVATHDPLRPTRLGAGARDDE